MTGTLTQTGEIAWARLIRAAQSASAAVEAALKAEGFPPLAWYDVLLELDRNPEKCLRHRDIHREMLLERYNVTRLVDRLEKDGLVEREPCPEDARGAVVRLTDKGAALRRAMWPAYREAIIRHFSSKLTEGELEQLARVLGALTGSPRFSDETGSSQPSR